MFSDDPDELALMSDISDDEKPSKEEINEFMEKRGYINVRHPPRGD